MFKLVSEDRQRKSGVFQIVRKSVPSGRAGVAECTSSIMSTARLVVRPTVAQYINNVDRCFAAPSCPKTSVNQSVNQLPDVGTTYRQNNKQVMIHQQGTAAAAERKRTENIVEYLIELSQTAIQNSTC